MRRTKTRAVNNMGLTKKGIFLLTSFLFMHYLHLPLFTDFRLHGGGGNHMRHNKLARDL